MLAKVDALLEKDGPMANAAGAAAAAIYSLMLSGMVPDQHWETSAAVAILLTLFAPAAKRRELNAKRKEIESAEGAVQGDSEG